MKLAKNDLRDDIYGLFLQLKINPLFFILRRIFRFTSTMNLRARVLGKVARSQSEV